MIFTSRTTQCIASASATVLVLTSITSPSIIVTVRCILLLDLAETNFALVTGFDLATTNDTRVRDSVVINQDDCVAVTSGNNIQVNNMYCNGSHGLSIGSVGGKSNNNVTNISFTNSVVLNAENGARIKSNSNTTGFISGILFENIRVENISIYGIDIQQDYLNGGPTGDPTNGVLIQDITIRNVTGTATEEGRNYYILCGEGSCENITINDVDIKGGGVPSACNFKTGGNFDCDGNFD
jgi:polygalacturonase